MTLQDIRDTRVWRSVFRGGSGANNLRRSMAIQQNVFLHLASVKARKKRARIQRHVVPGYA